MPAEFEMGLVAYIKADTVTLKRMAREGKVPAIVREKGAAKQGTFVYFKALCEHFGVARDEWPYTTSSQGYNAIRDFRLKVLSSAFRAEAGMTGGEDAATRSKVGTGVPRLFSAPIAYCAWQLDAHRLDAVGFIEIPLPNGKMVRAALERSWVIAVTDTHSTVVVGFIFCYGAEANSDDLQQLLHLCLRKWNRIPIPEELIHLRYGCLICMPGEDPRLEGLCPAELLVDNALINYSIAVHRFQTRTGCALNWGPPGQWFRRDVVERLFGVMETFGVRRTPSSTGSHPKDPLKGNPPKDAITKGVRAEHLEAVAAVLIGNRNGGTNEAASHTAPLLQLENLVEGRHGIPRRLPPLLPGQPDIGEIVVRCTVRARADKGRRPYVHCHGDYTGRRLLSNSSGVVGKSVILHINAENGAKATMFLEDGTEYEELELLGPWKDFPHTLRLRRQVEGLIKAGKIKVLAGEDAPTAYNRSLAEAALSQVKDKQGRHRSSRAASDLKTMSRQTGMPIAEASAARAARRNSGISPISPQEDEEMPSYLEKNRRPHGERDHE